MGEQMAKKSSAPVNIIISPELLEEMKAESRKTKEQRQADQDMLFTIMGEQMVKIGMDMIPKTPAKITPIDKNKIVFDPEDLEIG